MTKEELITKQQLEIEELKARIGELSDSIERASSHLIYIQQWSMKCPDFPRVAMSRICSAVNELE